MIYIQVKHFTESDSLYCVSLGNGTRHDFKNLKDCERFLVKTSKFLTKSFNELNLYFAQVFNLYRQNYFYFDNNRKKRHAELYANRRRINSNITAIEQTFEHLSFIHLSANANQAAFQQLHLISDYLIEIVIICKSINSGKSYGSINIVSDVLLQSVLGIKQNLIQYSLNSASAYATPAPAQHMQAHEHPLMKVI